MARISSHYQVLSRRGFLRSSALSGASLAIGSGAFSSAVFAAPAGSDAAALQRLLQGDVLTATSKDYDKARRTFSFNPRTDTRPALIARCKSETDVLHALDFARHKGLEIAVRSGGHDVLGASTLNGGMIIDLGGLGVIEPDMAAGIVHAGGGVNAGKLNDALQTSNMAVALGCNPAVGVSGLTLGGGIGWLAGTAGAACDNLLSARVVTANGRILSVNAEQEPDLFWALRGGGGNFGIVTNLVYRMRPLGNVVGGYIAYPGERMADFLHFYRDLMANAPDELTVEVLIMSPLKPVIFAMVCYTGDPAKADAVLAPLRKFGPPLADGLGVKPYTAFDDPTPEVGKFFQGPPPDPSEKNDSPGVYWMGANLDILSDAAIGTFAARLAQAPHGWAFSLGHYMHGAICRVDDAATPFIRAKGKMAYHFDTWWGDAGKAAAHMAWVDDSVAAMKPHSSEATYVNFLDSNDTSDVKRAYGANYARLAEIKRRYDPQNIFHRNRNIKPA